MVTIVNGVGIAHGVCIYDSDYFECAHLSANGAFPEREFARLCADLAERTDVHVRKDQCLRPSSTGRPRRRVLVWHNEGPCAFVAGCPDGAYLRLFSECFVSAQDERCCDFDLEHFLPEERRKARRIRGERYVLFRHGFGIRKHYRRRLLLLLRIYQKFITEGVLQLSEVAPPWSKYGAGRLTSDPIDLTREPSD